MVYIHFSYFSFKKHSKYNQPPIKQAMFEATPSLMIRMLKTQQSTRDPSMLCLASLSKVTNSLRDMSEPYDSKVSDDKNSHRPQGIPTFREFVHRFNARKRLKLVQGICTDITSQEVRKLFYSAACHMSQKVYSWFIFIFLTFFSKNTANITDLR